MKVWKEEVFASFTINDFGMKLSNKGGNNTEYGLGSQVFTKIWIKL
jgi:hypothetical protein